MAGNPKDSQLIALKDMVTELNKTIASQNEIIEMLRKSKDEREDALLLQIKNLQEQVD